MQFLAALSETYLLRRRIPQPKTNKQSCFTQALLSDDRISNGAIMVRLTITMFHCTKEDIIFVVIKSKNHDTDVFQSFLKNKISIAAKNNIKQ